MIKKCISYDIFLIVFDIFQIQVVIVTGGCGGIGSSFVFRFVNDGAKVAIIDFNEARAQEMINVLGSDKVKYYKVDVSNREACFKVVQQIANELGKVNHLVNAVAYFGSKVCMYIIIFNYFSLLLWISLKLPNLMLA